MQARLAARRPIYELIASQAQKRAEEIVSWSLDRGWPIGRLHEAWVVWRHGALCIAEFGIAAAGRLEDDDLARLRRAAARYERHVVARPSGFPAGGLAALAQIAFVAGERDARPKTLHFGIRALDQLSRRMRAAATAADLHHRDRAAARARRRRTPRSTARLLFRAGGAWPAWVALDAAGAPLLQDGELVVADVPGIAGVAPGREDPLYLAVLRDAQLLAGLWPPIVADGRTAMADTSSDHDLAAGRRRARPGPYRPPTDHRARADFAELLLAQLAAMPLQTVKRLSRELRDGLLKQHATRRAAQRASERLQLARRLADLHPAGGELGDAIARGDNPTLS